MNDYRIRPAEEKDIQGLLDIQNYEIMHGTATFDIEPMTYEQRRQWFQLHNIDNHPLIVAVRDSEVLGYASLSGYRTKEAYHDTVELSIYVDHKYQHRGIGHQLMKAILKDAKERPDVYTVISVITGDNQNSIEFHEKYGFRHCGRMYAVGEKFGKKLDIVNMQWMAKD